jgi:hypothetical protein
MKQERPKNGRKLLYIILALLGLVAGCVTAPALSPEEVTQINMICKDDATCIIEQTDDAMRRMLERLEYEREDRRNVEVDKLCALMLTCRASENLIISRGWGRTGQNAHLDKYGECVITKRNKLRDYSCMTPEDFRDAMERAGYY